MDVTLRFGLELTGSIDEVGTDWIYEGIADSYFENSWEYDEYILRANELINSKGISREAALREVFGRFSVLFELEGNPVIINYDVDAVNEQMYAYIEQVMAEYRTELEQMIRTVSAIKNSGKISSYDKKKVKEIYYRLVRLIHPDIRPELAQDEVIRDYWQRIVVAYRHNDIEELEELDVLVRTYLKQHNIEAGEISLSNIKERIVAIEKEIQTIISTDPYQYRFILEDKNAVNDRKQELKDELKLFREYGEQLDEVISSFNIRGFYA